MDHRLPSLMAVRKSEELASTVSHQRMFKLTTFWPNNRPGVDIMIAIFANFPQNPML
jgi:hypothetical protein